MLKTFYLIFGVALSLGACYLGYRRMAGIDGEWLFGDAVTHRRTQTVTEVGGTHVPTDP